MVDTQFHRARISHLRGRIGVLSLARWFCATVIALGVGLTGCSAPPPVLPPPVYYSSQPIPNPKRTPRPTTAIPASATTGGAPAEAMPETSPAAAPETQLPAAAQSPTVVPPPAGLPHDSSEYIEPPSR